MDWITLKEKAKAAGFIDNGDELELYFDGGFICFLKDGRIITQMKSDFDGMKQVLEVQPWQKR